MTTTVPKPRSSWFPREHGATGLFAVAALAGLAVANPFRSVALAALALLVAGFLLQHAAFLPRERRTRGQLVLLAVPTVLATAFLYTSIGPALLATALVPPAVVVLLALLVRRFDGPAKMDALPSNLAGALALAGPAWTLAVSAGLPEGDALLLWLLLALQGGVGVLLVQTRLPRPLSLGGLSASTLATSGFGLLLPRPESALWAALLLARPATAWLLRGKTVRFKTLGRIEALLQAAGALLLAHALRR